MDDLECNNGDFVFEQFYLSKAYVSDRNVYYTDILA